jgi:DNA-directed RNA polymerase subunit beta'
MAYSQKQIPLHGYVWIRFNDTVEDDSEFVESIAMPQKMRIDVFSSRLIKKSEEGELVTQYILTTPGRILLNKVLQDSLTFST